MQDVDDAAAKALAKCKAVFVNGFVFDELKPSAVVGWVKLSLFHPWLERRTVSNS